MADCFSLPNAAELVEEHRRCADEGFFAPCEMEDAADAIEAYRMEIAGLRMRRDELYGKIEQLELENAKLRTERDAAVADLTKNCCICAYQRTATCGGCHIDNDRWEWRGVQKEEENATD